MRLGMLDITGVFKKNNGYLNLSFDFKYCSRRITAIGI
jgi:hypothetical protein